MNLKAIPEIDELRRELAPARQQGRTIGFVPTMGALHEGHAALMRRARQECGAVVVSIFVNPTQFGPHEDLSRYPRTLEADLRLCEREGVDCVFSPTPRIMYPPEFQTFVEVTEIEKPLCGMSRPGHFRGVATVVLKLFNIVQADRAYFGQKDAQQARLIEQMVIDLNVPLKIVVVPTVREPDGLALSSRNRYLTSEERSRAVVLYQSLLAVEEQVKRGERDGETLRKMLAESIRATPGAQLDYAEIVDAVTLQSVSHLHRDAVAALAVRFGSTRLIDNMILKIDASHPIRNA